jgi:quinolinate synthase
MKKEHPEAKVVSYVNTTAEIKAESYICCTSSNSVKVVKSIPQKEEIIFIPDKYLCDYTSKEAGRDLICWQGYCDTHVKIKAEDVERLKREHPKAEVMAHPECIPEVLKVADTITSTGGMVKRAKSSSTNEFIIATELGIIHRLEKENPSKSFYPATQEVICPTMKMITLKKILRSLQNMQYEVKVKSSVAEGAKKAVDRMLAL